MVSRNRKIARRIGQAVANNVLDITGAVSGGAGVTVYATVNDLPTTGLTAGDEAFVSGSNRLYISNGTGWYSIGLVNTNPSITSVLDSDGGVTPFTLATDGSATVITITASDPEDIPLTYSYTVTSGSLTNGGGTTATVTQGTGSSSNIFTVTPTTNTDYLGNFDLTFTASDGINQASSITSFTLEFHIQDSKYTTLLLTAVDTSDNNNITDASSNNHTITVTGDAHAGTFSPYRHGGYSTYFDGNGDYIDVGSAIVPTAYDTDYTIEMWIYPTTTGSREDIFNQYAASASGRMAININTDATISFFQNGLSPAETKSSAISANNWYHLAVVNSSGTRSFYVNGSLIGTATGTVSMYSGNTEIGRLGDVASNYFTGYITDVRVVNGTAVYTGSFTPPVKRLTAVANTSLLTCHLPYIADGSTNNHTITVNGDTSTKAVSLFNNYSYSAADHGGSILLDGTGDYLIINDTNIANFGTNDFTIEAWVYCNDTTINQIVDTRPANTNGAYVTIAVGNGFGVGFYTNSAEIFTSGVGTINVGQWHHVTWVRNSGTISIYVDGTSVGSASNSTNFISSNVGIGWNAYLGENTGSVYISDLRIVKGTAIYTSNFTPPTFPLSSSGTSLHLKGTDASIIDKAQGSNITLPSGVVGESTTVAHSNSKSINFMVDDDTYCTFYNPFTFAGEFTIEFWYNLASVLNGQGTNVNSNYHTLLNLGNTFLIRFGDGGFGNYLHFMVASGFTGIDILPKKSDWIVGTGWHHFAATRDASNYIRYYWDGSLMNSARTTGPGNAIPDINHDFNNASSLRSGTFGAVGDRTIGTGFRGYLQDLRITNGLRRYTANFTPPTLLKG